MRIRRADQHKRMPWKNGGGETTEIAVSPENAGLSDFDWRVSMARVDADGPFSSFPGIDRTLAILEGGGIVLDVQGRAAKRLAQETEPYAFPADVPTSARLIAGTVVDFNVMSRRGAIVHKVDCCRGECTSTGGFVRLVICRSGTLDVQTAADSARLGRYDAAVLSEGESAELAPGADSEFYLVEFRPS